METIRQRPSGPPVDAGVDGFVDDTVSRLLGQAAKGDRAALDRVFERLYPELRRLADHVRRGRAGETLNATALAHEAWFKLVGGRPVSWKDRAHFLAVAARAMRQVLVDDARARLAKRRGGAGRRDVSLDGDHLAAPLRPDRLIALDAALVRLAAVDPRRAAVVEYRFFAGLTAEEVAAVLDVSTKTVERDWRAARAWLAVELEEDGP